MPRYSFAQFGNEVIILPSVESRALKPFTIEHLKQVYGLLIFLDFEVEVPVGSMIVFDGYFKPDDWSVHFWLQKETIDQAIEIENRGGQRPVPVAQMSVRLPRGGQLSIDVSLFGERARAEIARAEAGLPKAPGGMPDSGPASPSAASIIPATSAPRWPGSVRLAALVAIAAVAGALALSRVKSSDGPERSDVARLAELPAWDEFCPQPRPMEHLAGPTLLGWTPDGSHVVATWEHAAVLINAATGDRVGSYPSSDDTPHAVAVSPDGKLVVTATCGSTDQALRVFRSGDGKRLAMAGGLCPQGVGILADGRVLWQGAAELLVSTVKRAGKGTRIVAGIRASPRAVVLEGGTHVIAATNEGLRAFGPTGQQTGVLPGTGRASSLAVGGGAVFVGSPDSLSVFRTRSLSEGREITEVGGRPCRLLAAAPGAEVAACVQEDRVLLVGIDQPTRSYELPTQSLVRTALVSPDGGTLLTVSDGDCSVRRWTLVAPGAVSRAQ